MGFWTDLINRWIPRSSKEEAKKDVAEAATARSAKKLFGGLPKNAHEEAPVIDFERIEQAFQEESLAMQAITRYVELIFKADWTFNSKDPKALAYVNKRLEEIGDQMGQPFALFLIEIGLSLVKYNNCIFYRLADKKGVINSYHVLDTPNTRLFVNDDLNPLLWRQYMDRNGHVVYRDFPAKDSHHIHNNRPSGRFFGIPFMLPVLDDIRILREIESALIRSIHKNIEPLVQHVIGTDERPTTNEEIGMIQEVVEKLPMDGQLVTSHRHAIKVHGAQGEGLQIEKYMRYFEQRVMTGLGMPETAFGRASTSNKSTAEQLAKELHDRVKAYQRLIEIAVNFRVIRDILAEPGAPVPKDKVLLKFNEIDLDYLIKKENHAIFKYTANAIHEDEMRLDLGLEKVSEKDRKKFFSNLYGAADPQADASNRNAPSNQHGSSEALEDTDLITSSQSDSELLEAEERIRLRSAILGLYESVWSDVGFCPQLAERLNEGTKVTLDRLRVVGDRRSYLVQAVERLGPTLLAYDVKNAVDARKVFIMGQQLLSRVIASRSMPPQLI